VTRNVPFGAVAAFPLHEVRLAELLRGQQGE